MVSRFQVGRRLKANVRRVAKSLLRECLQQLAVTDLAERDEAIHQARKSLKRLRALLRLIRPAIGRNSYREENGCFRSAGRRLTEVRDARIVVETLETVIGPLDLTPAERVIVEGLREEFGHKLDAAHRHLREPGIVDQICHELLEAKGRVKSWSDVPDRWKSLGRGLKRSYRKAAEASRQAANEPSIESLHNCRRRVRYLHDQLRILRFVSPGRLQAAADEVDRVSQLLGSVRDMALLEDELRAQAILEGHKALKNRLIRELEDRQSAATTEAFWLARKFFESDQSTWILALKSDWQRMRKREAPSAATM